MFANFQGLHEPGPSWVPDGISVPAPPYPIYWAWPAVMEPECWRRPRCWLTVVETNSDGRAVQLMLFWEEGYCIFDATSEDDATPVGGVIANADCGF